jgi:hypothetical protein
MRIPYDDHQSSQNGSNRMQSVNRTLFKQHIITSALASKSQIQSQCEDDDDYVMGLYSPECDKDILYRRRSDVFAAARDLRKNTQIKFVLNGLRI